MDFSTVIIAVSGNGINIFFKSVDFTSPFELHFVFAFYSRFMGCLFCSKPTDYGRNESMDQQELVIFSNTSPNGFKPLIIFNSGEEKKEVREMGTFIDIFRHEPLRLEHKDRFMKQAKLLMKQGGLMKVVRQPLFGYQFKLLAWPDFQTYYYGFGQERVKMVADYSLFENCSWEETVVYADPTSKCAAVQSGKVGCLQFAMATLALHLLEGLYSDCTNWAALPEHRFDIGYKAQRWIHTLFDDVPNQPFLSFWLFYKRFGTFKEELVYRSYEGKSMLSAVGVPNKYFETTLEFWQCAAVCNGIEKAMEQANRDYKNDRKEGFIYPNDLLNKSSEALEQIFACSENQVDAVFEALMKTQRFYCEMSEPLESESEKPDLKNFEQSILFLGDLAGTRTVSSALFPSSFVLPVFVLAKACELACRDFWREYEKNPWIEDYFTRTSRKKAKAILEEPLSTKKYLTLYSNPMLALWNKDDPFPFDKDLRNWFAALNRRYFMLVEKLAKKPLQNPAQKVCSIIDRVEKEDRKAIVFQDFLKRRSIIWGIPHGWLTGFFLKNWQTAVRVKNMKPILLCRLLPAGLMFCPIIRL